MRRARRRIGALAVAAVALALAPGDQQAAPIIDGPLRDALGGIDFVSGREVFDDLLGAEADVDLVQIASAPEGDVDPGLRIHAYQALAHYPTDVSETALRQAVTAHAASDRSVGVETVYARTAMESLARVAGAGAVADLAPVLAHPSRDLRATAARALAATGAAEAIDPLRARLAVETEPMVIIALQRALVALEGQ